MVSSLVGLHGMTGPEGFVVAGLSRVRRQQGAQPPSPSLSKSSLFSAETALVYMSPSPWHGEQLCVPSESAEYPHIHNRYIHDL